MRARGVPITLLLVLALGLLGALLGVPTLTPPAPAGARTGVVVDARGYGAAFTSVYHFDAAGELVERTLTDEQGRFALRVPTAVAHVLAHPERDRGLAPRWRLDEPLEAARLEFVLAPARPLDVLVRDELGATVPGAEVRVYERGPQVAAIAMARTGSDGVARLVTPPRADVAVHVPGEPGRWAWRQDVALPGEGPGRLEVELAAPRVVRGVVHGNGAPVEGLCLLAGDPAAPQDFAFTTSAADGSFALAVADVGCTELQVVDPEQRYLPRRLVLTDREPLDVALVPGAPLEVAYGSPASDPRAWVWAWNSEEQLWSWGLSTAADGRVRLRVGRRFGLHAEAVSPGYEGLTLWDLEYRSPFLRLGAGRAQHP